MYWNILVDVLHNFNVKEVAWILKPSIGRIFSSDNFRSGHMSADDYRIVAIIAIIPIIAINCSYCQNCEVIKSIIVIILVIISWLFGNYCNYLATITIIETMAIIIISWHCKELPTKFEACDCHDCLSSVKSFRDLLDMTHTLLRSPSSPGLQKSTGPSSPWARAWWCSWSAGSYACGWWCLD